MTEISLESLAARVAELERRLEKSEARSRTHDWHSMIGALEDNEFNRSWIAETEAIREADRKAAREGKGESAE